jgi:hypothetical protein
MDLVAVEEVPPMNRSCVTGGGRPAGGPMPEAAGQTSPSFASAKIA